MSAAPDPSTTVETRTNKNKGRILVVDDDRLVLYSVTHGLAQAGYEVIDADNGDDAILLAREHRPSLALLDIRMEGKSGLDVAETLRDAYRIPFMFLSAFADAETLAKVQGLGALAYLVKPLEVAQILPAVEAAFERIRRGDTSGMVAAAVSASGSGSVPVPAPAPAPAPAQAAPLASPVAPPVSVKPVAAELADAVPLALGVLMGKHTLTREQAWAHLQKLAAGNQVSPQAQADRLLMAVEELARSAL